MWDTWYIRDGLLLMLFAVQHSLGTTARAYNLQAKLTGRPYLWNAVYNVFTFVVLYLIVKFWLGTGVTIWKATGVAYYVVQGFQLFSVFMFFYFFKYTSFSKWLGVQQVYCMIKGKAQDTAYTFKTTGAKRYVRFPHHTCLIAIFWSMPHMTLDLLYLAVFATIYTYWGTVHQDFRGIRYLGEPWLEYRSRSRLIFPAPEMMLHDFFQWLKTRAAVAQAVPGNRAVSPAAISPEAAATDGAPSH